MARLDLQWICPSNDKSVDEATDKRCSAARTSLCSRLRRSCCARRQASRPRWTRRTAKVRHVCVLACYCARVRRVASDTRSTLLCSFARSLTFIHSHAHAVCVKVVDDVKSVYTALQTEKKGAKKLDVAESALAKHCSKKLSTKDNKLVRLSLLATRVDALVVDPNTRCALHDGSATSWSR